MQENNNQAEQTKPISNGRNRRRSSNKVSNTTPQAPICGLIEDTSVFTEKLSGQHNKGYAENKPETTTESESTPTPTETQCEQVAETKSCNCSKKANDKSKETPKSENAEKAPKPEKAQEYAGPSFEETKNTQNRALEVPLKKVPHKSEKIAEKDAVSYSKVSASMNKTPQKKGLLSKIRAFFSKLVGKKPKKNQKNFKNNRGGYKKNYSKGYKKSNFEKNGNFEKNKENSARPNNRRKNYNNRRPNSYNKAKPTTATKE